MQMETERGMIYVVAEYQNSEQCKMNGFEYAWHSEKLNADVYDKILDDMGHRRHFAIVYKN